MYVSVCGGRQKEAVIPLSAARSEKPFHVRNRIEMALQHHPMPKPQRAWKKEEQRQKSREIDFGSIRCLTNKELEKENVETQKTTHHRPDLTSDFLNVLL